MRKIMLLTFVLTVFALSAFAQGEEGKGLIAKGFKVGLSMSNWSADDIEDNDMKLGFAGGGFVTFGLSPQFAIQPEVMFCMKGTQFDGGGSDKLKYKVDYLVIPVLMKYMIPTNGNVSPNLFVGPEVGFLLSGKATMGSEEEDIKEYLKNTDFGLAFGAGMDIKMESFTLMFDARYTLGLSNILDEDEDEDDELKNTDILVTVGLGF